MLRCVCQPTSAETAYALTDCAPIKGPAATNTIECEDADQRGELANGQPWKVVMRIDFADHVSNVVQSTDPRSGGYER